MFGGRMPQYIAQFTVSAEAELAGKPDYRGLADMGDIRHLADSQIGGFFGMLTNVLCHGALRRAQRRIHMSMRSSIPTEDCTAILPSSNVNLCFRAYRPYNGDLALRTDRNMNCA